MNHRSIPLFFVLPFVLFAWAACQKQPEEPSARSQKDRLVVYVVHYPLQYFTERIGGEHVDVHFPAPADIDPMEWLPDDETILRYQRADLVLINGAGYENWVEQASLPSSAVVNTVQDVSDRLLSVEDAFIHSHGPGGLHSHAGTAPITWLDPTLAIEQGRSVKRALSERLPAHQSVFRKRFLALEEDLHALDREIAGIVKADPELPLLASHPVYHYLEARYGLNLVSLHWEPDEMPDQSSWESLDSKRSEHPAEWILWEDIPLPETESRLAERGVRSVVFNPSSQPPAGGDYLSSMWENVAGLRTVFLQAEGPGQGAANRAEPTTR